jgi:hypothetical protein
MSITLKNTPGSLNIELRRGDDFTRDLTYRDDDGVIADFTGCKISAMARVSADSSKLYDLPFIFSDTKPGVIEITFTKELTAEYGNPSKVLEMKYDVQIETPEGNVTTIIVGSIKVLGDYTRREFN